MSEYWKGRFILALDHADEKNRIVRQYDWPEWFIKALFILGYDVI